MLNHSCEGAEILHLQLLLQLSAALGVNLRAGVWRPSRQQKLPRRGTVHATDRNGNGTLQVALLGNFTGTSPFLADTQRLSEN